MKSSPLTALERRSALSLASIFALRMLGLFMLLPVIRLLGEDLAGATLPLLGLAIGIYGLSQALLQLPLGVLSDKIGRKPIIYAGLLVFIIGSLVAANAHTIWDLIVGRALQGAGAIASAVMALAADLSRPHQRSKMMAMIGGSIGLAFALSLVMGPLLANWLSLQGMFYLIALLAVFALLVAVFVVPNTAPAKKATVLLTFKQRWQFVTQKGRIFILSFAVFVIHWALVGIFLIIPQKLIESGFMLAQHSWIYLLVLALSIALMLPMMLKAESRGWHRQVMQLAFVLLAASLIMLLLDWQHIAIWISILTLFFAGFNLLEAKLPSTVSNLYGAQYRGTALGVFTTSQFLGAFLGGSVTGYLLPILGDTGVLWLNICLMLLAAIMLGVLGNLPEVKRLTIIFDEKFTAESVQQAALKLEGVIEAVASEGDGKVYLRVDNNSINQQELLVLGRIDDQ